MTEDTSRLSWKMKLKVNFIVKILNPKLMMGSSENLLGNQTQFSVFFFHTKCTYFLITFSTNFLKSPHMSNHFTYIEALPVAFHHSDIYCKVTNPYRNSPDLAQVSGHLWFNIPTHFPDSSFTDIAHWATPVALSSTSIICQKSFLHRALLQETACTVLSHSLFHWLALSVPLLFN